jgi:hypothetical protein
LSNLKEAATAIGNPGASLYHDRFSTRTTGLCPIRAVVSWIPCNQLLSGESGSEGDGRRE